jgi:hypothetical protein
MSALTIPQPTENPESAAENVEGFVWQPKPPRSSHALTSSFYLKVEPRTLPADIERALETFFMFGDRKEVLHFLAQHRWLVDLLLQASERLIAIFGFDCPKMLQVFDDEEEFKTLFCLLVIKGDPTPRFEGLEEFDRNWWLSHCGEARGLLNFDIEISE